jgi:hypothetical protein
MVPVSRDDVSERRRAANQARRVRAKDGARSNLGEQAKRPIDKTLGEQANRPID